MLYTLLLVVCLRSAPAECYHYQIPIETDVMQSTLFIQVQGYIAQWEQQHSEMFVDSFKLIEGQPI